MCVCVCIFYCYLTLDSVTMEKFDCFLTGPLFNRLRVYGIRGSYAGYLYTHKKKVNKKRILPSVVSGNYYGANKKK